RSDSESSASPRFVEPFRSEKTIVTVFRTSRGGAATASGVPQKPQRRNRSGLSSPQDGHVAMRRVYAALQVSLGGAPVGDRRLGTSRRLPQMAVGRPAPASGGDVLQ